jgi:hypothetical protein
LNTYAGSRVSLLNSSMQIPESPSPTARYFAVNSTCTGSVFGG